MRQLFHLVKGVAEDLNHHLERTVPVDKEMDVKDITVDHRCHCHLCLRCSSMQDPKSEFREHGKNIFDFDTKRSLKMCVMFFWPGLVPWLKLKLFRKESTKFLTETLLNEMG